MIAGVILAAGAARRMGKSKQLLLLGEKPMVWHVTHAACLSRLDSVILVTGDGAGAVVAATQDLPATIVHNANWQAGQAGSLAAGLNHLAPDTEAVMFLLSDQPLVTPELIDSLIDAYRNSGCSIVCPFYEGLRGTPVLFGWKEWKDALTTLGGDQGARQIIAAHPEFVCRVPVDSGEIFQDVDTEKDYQLMCEIFQKRRTMKGH